MHPNCYLISQFSFLTKGSPSYSRRCVVYFNENPRTIMNGAYSTMFDTNIPGARHVFCAA